MSTNNSCPFCNMSVAPFDPYRLERKGQAAHESCVKAKSLPGVRDACANFLADRGATFEASALEIKAKRAFDPKAFAKVVSTVLRTLLAQTNDLEAVSEVERFASRMGDRLFVDIDVDTGAPAPRTNGASSFRRA